MVFRLGDPDPWHLSTDNDVGVNFVVSCLINDGCGSHRSPIIQPVTGS
jgi:hypothetical protein